MTTTSIQSIQDDFLRFKPQPKGRRPFGLCKGQFRIPDDFDSPLPANILAAFEGESASDSTIPTDRDQSRDAMLDELRELIRQKRAENSKPDLIGGQQVGNSWLAGAGMFKDNPLFEEYLATLEENRLNREFDHIQ